MCRYGLVLRDVIIGLVDVAVVFIIVITVNFIVIVVNFPGFRWIIPDTTGRSS